MRLEPHTVLPFPIEWQNSVGSVEEQCMPRWVNCGMNALKCAHVFKMAFQSFGETPHIMPKNIGSSVVHLRVSPAA